MYVALVQLCDSLHLAWARVARCAKCTLVTPLLLLLLTGCLGSTVVQSRTTTEVSGGRLLPADMVELRVRTALVHEWEERPWFTVAGSGKYPYDSREVRAREVLMQLSRRDGRCEPSKAPDARRKASAPQLLEPMVGHQVGAMEVWWRLYDKSFRVRSLGGAPETIEVRWDLRQLWALPNSSIVFTDMELIDLVSKQRLLANSMAYHADTIVAAKRHKLTILQLSDLREVSLHELADDLGKIVDFDGATVMMVNEVSGFVWLYDLALGSWRSVSFAGCLAKSN